MPVAAPDRVKVQVISVGLTTDTLIGPWVVTTNDKYMVVGAKLVGPIIKNGASIGANSTILPGVVIGEGAVIGSGSVVTKDVADETSPLADEFPLRRD